MAVKWQMKLHILLPTTLLMLLFSTHDTQAAKILGFFPFPAKSHTIVFMNLMEELARRGHEVTVVSPISNDNPAANYTQIKLDISLLGIFGKLNFEEIAKEPLYNKPITLWNGGNTICEQSFQTLEMQKLLKSEAKFDLILIELFCTECFLGFVHKFQCPIVAVNSFIGSPWLSRAMGDADIPSHIPNTFLPFEDRMSFTERFVNALFWMYITAGRSLYYMPAQDRIAREFFGESMPPLWEIEKNISMALLNSHYSFNYPRSHLPSVVEVGGMHMRKQQKLEPDLQKFLDEAENGVIYFSMGSIIQSDKLAQNKIQVFLDAFSRLPQKILWKWESESLPGKPKNVRIGKWLPQNDILGHPNIKVFLTHGGLLGTLEALHNGVPRVVIPVYGDQDMNAKRAVASGIGVRLDYSTLTAEAVYLALTEVLNNASYRENAQRWSNIFRNQPETPLDRAVFWIEYVIQHQGAHHLRSAGSDLCWFQYFLLDVATVIVLATCLVLGVTFCLVTSVYRLIRGKKTKEVKKPNESKTKSKPKQH